MKNINFINEYWFYIIGDNVKGWWGLVELSSYIVCDKIY